MASFNAECNKKDYEKIKSNPDKNENRQNSIIKTKHEDEKNSRSNLKVSNSNLEEAPQNELTSNPQSVTFVELRRLEQINGRSTRLVFKGLGDLPPTQEILNLDPDIVSVLEAKNRAPSCFCIFTDSKKKVAAEQELDGARFRRGNILVDKHRKMVPVDTGDLEGTREPTTLAVHGLPRDVTAHHLKKVFPDAQTMSIARRGGSAFLKYSDYSSALKAFQEAEDVSVKGCRVQVLFSHLIDRTRSKTNGSSKRDSPAISSQPISSQSEKAPVKMDMKCLLSTLNGAGLQMDKLQKDYIRGGCEPGSGPDIRTAWMERLKTNSSNKLSRSLRLDLVDNVWNFFDKDEDTQKRLKIEMENSGKKKMEELTQEIREKPYKHMLEAVDKEIEKRNCRESKKYGQSPGRKKYGECDYPYSPDKERHHTDLPSSCSPDKKKHRVYVYPSSPERNRHRTRETSSSSSPERKKEYREAFPGKVDSRRENRDKTSSDSSPSRISTRMPSLKHCKRKIEYDSSSPSPPPERINTRRDASEKQESGSDGKENSSEGKENKLASIKGDKQEKQEKKYKQASDSDKSKDSEVKKVPNKFYTVKINQKGDGMNKEETSKSLKTSEEESSFQRIVEVKEGFTRMALVMAWRLGYNSEMGQDKCKAVASSMVAVWTKYGFSYSELKDMYVKEKERDPDVDDSEDVSFVELRRLLHKCLRKKVEDGHAMPRKFNFSMLIDLTMFYFEKAT